MRTLIVEDDPLIAGLIKTYISSISEIPPVIVGTMLDAEQAISTVEPLDIITLDINLPDSRGQATLDKIAKFKQLHPNALLIIVTGVALAKQEESAIIQMGGDGLMIKQETLTSERRFFSTLVNILESISAAPKRFTKNVELLERVTKRVASRMAECAECYEKQGLDIEP